MAVLFKWSICAFLLCLFLHKSEGALSYRELLKEAFDKGYQAERELFEVTKPNYRNHDVYGATHNCRWQMGLVHPPTLTTLAMEKNAVFYLAATQHIAQATSSTPAQLLSNPLFFDEWKRLNVELEGGCEGDSVDVTQFCRRRGNARFRTADGLCNNVNNPTWGRSHTPHARLASPVYGDIANIGDLPRTLSVGGSPLPSARSVSLTTLRHFNQNKDPEHTHMLMAMGQFVDHDVTLTPTSKGMDGSDINCCDAALENPIVRPECFPISLSNDPIFAHSCMTFVRSAPAIATGCGLSHRETLNQITHSVDGSMIYGSTDSEMVALRDTSGGLMRTAGNGLPPAAPDTDCMLPDPNLHCLKAGDVRSNEILNLGMLHILFLREHNSIARQLEKKCRRLRRNNNRLFEEARRIVIGILQQITFNEWLPKVLGSKTMREHRLEPDQYYGYNPNVNPSVLTEFSTAAFRYGHSQIPGSFKFLNEDFTENVVKSVSDTFFKPAEIQYTDKLRQLIRFMTTDNTMDVDSEFASSIQDELFKDDAGIAFDLSAANIQRGRDHGLPPYMAMRAACGLTTVSTFAALPDHSPSDRMLLEGTYADVRDIDLYTAGISEIHVDDGVVGPTFACIIGKQFNRLKFGDSHYFERRRSYRSYKEFTNSQIAAIKKYTMAKVMCANSGLKFIQRDVFKLPDCIKNPTLDCSMLPKLDIRRFC